MNPTIPGVSVSILIYDSPVVQVRQAVECLRREGVGKIFLLYNGPQREYLTPQEFADCEILRIPNRGYGSGHNVAIRRVLEHEDTLKPGQEGFHLVLNADVRWEGEVVGPMVEYMRRNRDVMLMSPKTFYPDGRYQNTARMLPTPLDMLLRLMPGGVMGKRRKRYLMDGMDRDAIRNVPYLLGNFMLFRLDALRVAGIFDERFFMYPEDIDITRRMHKIGRTLYYPAVSVVHDHARASRRNPRMFWIHFVNMMRYFSKWGWFYDPERRRMNRRLRR